MKGVLGRRLRYVGVVARTSAEGAVTPLQIIWDAGTCYDIDQVLDCRQAVSRRTGGVGMRYTVRVGAATTYLWFENPRWFVEEKLTSIPEA